MITFNRYPGEGLVFDVTYTVDVSTWTVTASLICGTTAAVIVATTADVHTRRVSVTGALIGGIAGRVGIVKVVATDPSAAAYPVVEEVRVVVGAV